MKTLYVIRRNQYHFGGPSDLMFQQVEDKWNQIFNISYRRFRHFMDGLRQDSVKGIKFTSTLNLYNPQVDRLRARDGWWIFPADDDDWYHPDLLEILISNPVADDIHAVRWQYGWYEADRMRFYTNADQSDCDYRYQTNNYCLKSPYLMDLGHCQANSLFSGQPGEAYVNEPLSIHNRNLSSLSMWWHETVTNRDQVISLFERFKKGPPSGIAPAVFDPYIDRMVDFYRNKLKVRPKLWL